MTLDHVTPPEPDDFRNSILNHATEIVDTLATLTPRERALVLHEVQRICHEQDEAGTAAVSDEDTSFLIGQWLAGVFSRLSPPAQAGLVEVAKRLDEMERFERLVDTQE